MRRFLIVLAMIACSLLLGGYSAWYSIQRTHGIGGIVAGPWVAWPFAGGSAVDPYTAAKVTRDGNIPLGATEGLAFEATSDSLNQPLDLKCAYALKGVAPPSKLWTLASYKPNGDLITPSGGGYSAVQSRNIIRFPDSTFQIFISQKVQPKNWLSISGVGKFYLVLRVYDTPVTNSSGLVTPQLPSIIKLECDK